MAEEGLQKTSNELIYIANPMHYAPDKIHEALDDLNRALKHSWSAAVAAL